MPEKPDTKRKAWTEHHVSVRHIAKPTWAVRENGPHLYDLRAFVEACEGLPGELFVRITSDSPSESGRHNVTFSVDQRVVVPDPAPMDDGDVE